MTIELWGALGFGVVIGYVTYRTVRRTQGTGLADIATVIGAVGGAAITALFPAGSALFGAYGIGLAAGFFIYLGIAVLLAGATGGLSGVNEWLGEPQGGSAPAGGRAGAGGRVRDIPPIPE